MPALPKSAPKSPRRTRPSSTSCSARPTYTYRLRDERGVYSDIWASGLMRRAALAGPAGRASRRIATPQQMLDASLDEMWPAGRLHRRPSAD